MNNEPSSTSRRNRRLVGVVGLLLAGGIGALAATSSASAASTTPSPAAASSVPGASGQRAPAHTATSVRPGEKAQTGATLATLQAAALKAVPGGTVYRVETDADGATFEAHMTKADGSEVTVKFDKSFKVTAIQAGMGAGGPGGAPGTPGRAGPAGGPPAATGGAGV